MSYEEIVAAQLSEKRFQHSLRVAQVARKLADVHDVDSRKAYHAGVLHDYCKEYSKEKLIKYAVDHQLISDILELHMLQTLHGPVAAEVLKEKDLVSDQSILQAIKYHTTGHPEMDILAKIIFIADYIEPDRKTPNIDFIERVAYRNLDEALLLIINQTMSYLQSKNSFIHPNMLYLRNKLLYLERKIYE